MKYVSCELAQHGICFIDNAIWSCCYSPAEWVEGSSGPVILMKNYHGEKINWDEFFSIIHKRREDFKNCYWLKENDWPEEDYINQIYITHFEKCNADCFYCSGCQGRERDNKTKPYSILPILKDMKKRGIMPKGSEIHIGGGEPTLYHELDSIIKDYVLSGYVNRILVPTSAILFSKRLYEALNKNLAHSIISLDCGSEETYFKIKRVNKFKQVMQTLEKYSKTETSRTNLLLKYIVIPDINDNETEFDLFLQKIKELGITRIALDIEATYARKMNYKINPKFFDFIVWAEEYSKKLGFETELYMFYKHALTFRNKDESQVH